MYSIIEHPLYAELPSLYTLVFVFFGAALGSFFNVLSIRWPNYQTNHNDKEASYWLKLRGHKNSLFDKLQAKETLPLLGGRSYCPSCSSKIPLYNNIPIISWLLLKGKSRCCQSKIKFRYLSFELAGALIFSMVAYFVGPTAYGLVLGIILATYLLISVMDASDGFIPRELMDVLLMLSLYLATSENHWTGIKDTFITFVATFFVLYTLSHFFRMATNSRVIAINDIYLLSISSALVGPVALAIYPLMIPFLFITNASIKCGIIGRGEFLGLIGAKAIPAAPSIGLSTFLLIGLMVLK